ncbi:alpha-amylase [Streptomyces ficellus]|uniref:Alpha-amylase n=1 Tax=Streptomyces ficellus TaxID=1977088 RepID=A0A6I6FAN5_9ACTN|nr:alpha-amylase [Streptomyces ficellus]QGV77997.1 alpha-amylase [Streptomyces ficellus]
MFALTRSTIRVAIAGATAGLAAVAVCLTASTGASAAPLPAGGEAPSCVAYASGWRYTFVTNDCGSAQDVTVTYLDGTTVPCRSVAPGGTATFPGYGTGGNAVTGVALCTTSSP